MKELRKYYRIKGTPEEIYAALVNPFAIALWTGAKAEMTEEPGTRFMLFDEDIEGINISFEKNSRVSNSLGFLFIYTGNTDSGKSTTS